MNKEMNMGSHDHKETENFSLEIDDAVEGFFSVYEKKAPKMDDASQAPEPDTISEDDITLEMDDISQAPEPGTVPREKTAPETDAPSLEPVFDLLSEAEKSASQKQGVGIGRRAKKRLDRNATQLFNSLTEVILTIDWEVNDTNLEKARDVLAKILAAFPVLKESRAQNIVEAMRTTLDSIAASPQRVPASATTQLEKAIPILRRVASGAQIEDGFHDLIEDAIAGLEACSIEDEPAESEISMVSPSLTSVGADSFDTRGGGTGLMDIPAAVSGVLRDHSEVLDQLAPRTKRLQDLHAASNGSESVHVLFQKICSLLELQTQALQGAISPNCAIAIFPIGKITNLSGFIGFQLKAMGVCLKHTRVLERVYKKQPHPKMRWQPICLLRIIMEKQIDVLSKIAGSDDVLV
jgi:hypothetical protein